VGGYPEPKSPEAHTQAAAPTLGRSSPSKGSEKITFEQTLATNTLSGTIGPVAEEANGGQVAPSRAGGGSLQSQQPPARLGRIMSHRQRRRNLWPTLKADTMAPGEGSKHQLHVRHPKLNGLQKTKTSLTVAFAPKSRRGEHQSTATLHSPR
jgi:hypothetical protein